MKLSSLRESQDVADFVRFALENEQTIAEEARFIPMTRQQVDAELQKLEDALA